LKSIELDEENEPLVKDQLEKLRKKIISKVKVEVKKYFREKINEK